VRWTLLGLGMLLGALVLGGARFAFVHPPEAVHYHANFLVFVDGERLDLSADRYMEDVAACSADPDQLRPEDRIHLHENDPDVVHVHHGGATWGHLFTNLGMALGGDYLFLADGTRLFDGEGGRTIEFFVNGLQVSDIHNRAVRSEDRVLVSIGAEPSEVVAESQVPRVASDAVAFNSTADPASCAGSHQAMGLADRLRHAFWGA
jgi:hypothetical protein